MARGRMETEIQRRKEHLNEATNFEKARGFVRTNWKTKNWNPLDDPTLADSSTDSEDAELLYRDENRDKIDDSMFGSPTKAPFSPNDSDRSPFTKNSDYSPLSPGRKRKLFLGKGKTGPQVIDVQENETDSTTLLSTEEQLNTLKGIIEYNKGLKPARRAKDSLPEILVTGIAARDRITKDPKKDKIVVERNYH